LVAGVNRLPNWLSVCTARSGDGMESRDFAELSVIFKLLYAIQTHSRPTRTWASV